MSPSDRLHARLRSGVEQVCCVCATAILWVNTRRWPQLLAQHEEREGFDKKYLDASKHRQEAVFWNLRAIQLLGDVNLHRTRRLVVGSGKSVLDVVERYLVGDDFSIRHLA